MCQPRSDCHCSQNAKITPSHRGVLADFPVLLVGIFLLASSQQFGLTPNCQGAEMAELTKWLEHRVIDPELPWREIQEFTEQRVMPMPDVKSVSEWETWIETTREATLDNVVFRGEAQGWRDAETQVEWLETIETEHGYRIRKLRYEALPGLWIPALLYEPLELTGKVPVVMNVNGHDGTGKAADYKQIRCINQAKRGMIALNPEWIGMGQLRDPGFVHYKLNQLDLCGTSGVAVHFLSMKRGLDILLSHEHADSERVAVAGLSGGGWQTIFISSLDSRVTLSNPVAGYSSFKTRARHTSDLGDSEQTPVDLGIHADYAVLTAMRAPRPTLLTFNAKDQCCFRADHAMQPLVDAAAPIFQLYGQQSSLRTHVNEDPGTHNFGLDNRQQLYKMFGDFFYPEDEQFDATEIPSEEELLSAEELQVPVPEGNHNFHSLALAQAESLPKNVEIPQSPKARQAWLTFKRSRLREILHIRDYDAKVVQKEDVPGSSERAHTLRFRIGGEWTVPATLLTPENPTKSTVILLADTGRSTLGKHSKQKLDDGHRVLAVDPFYFGESKITQRDFLYGLLVSAVGERPLGIQSSQIQAIAAWAGQEFGQPVDCLAHGPRTSLIALSAAAANPERFQTLDFVGSFESLKDILDQDLTMQDSPELFCFGLLAEFDIPLLRVLANGQ